MIRLQKLAEPQVLADNAVKWTEEPAKKAIYDDFVANELKDSAQYASMARSLHALLGPSLEALLDE